MCAGSGHDASGILGIWQLRCQTLRQCAHTVVRSQQCRLILVFKIQKSIRVLLIGNQRFIFVFWILNALVCDLKRRALWLSGEQRRRKILPKFDYDGTKGRTLFSDIVAVGEFLESGSRTVS